MTLHKYLVAPLAKLTDSSVDLPIFGGRLDVRWEPGARITSVGGLAHFAMFLKNTGLFDRLCEDFPLCHTSNDACSKRDILGTAILAILLGKARYAHINAIRFDVAAKKLPDLDEIVSEDTVRRAFRGGDEKRLDSRLLKHGKEVSVSLLSHRYVLDVDNTAKPTYGHQEGAEAGYNPVEPGRPSHDCHSYFIGSTRISLGVDVLPGKRHAGGCGMPRLSDRLAAAAAVADALARRRGTWQRRHHARGRIARHPTSVQDQEVRKDAGTFQAPRGQPEAVGLRKRLEKPQNGTPSGRMGTDETRTLHQEAGRAEGRSRRAEATRKETEGPEDVRRARSGGPRRGSPDGI